MGSRDMAKAPQGSMGSLSQGPFGARSAIKPSTISPEDVLFPAFQCCVCWVVLLIPGSAAHIPRHGLSRCCRWFSSVGMEHLTSPCWSTPGRPNRGAVAALGGSAGPVAGSGRKAEPAESAVRTMLAPLLASPRSPAAPPAAPGPARTCPRLRGTARAAPGQALGAPWVPHTVPTGGSRAGVPVPTVGTRRARAHSGKAAASEPSRLLRPARPAR